MVFPKILNYAVGAILILFGILWLVNDQQWLFGISSIVFGILVFVFPAILNYLMAGWLALIGLGLILGTGSMVLGIIILVFAVVVMVFPAILNYIFGLFLIVVGIVAIINHFGWTGDLFALMPLVGLGREKEAARFIEPISLN